MKLRYFIATLAAVLTLAVSCEKEADHYLSEVSLSTSYVSIPVAGGTTTISVDAVADWTIEDAPSWVTVSPTKGSKGTTSLSFGAASAIDGRSGSVKLICNGATQYINVIQGLPVVSKASCAEVIAGIEGKTYLVTGVCTAITNTQYGNFYLNDGTGELYIYGTVDASGSYNWSSFNIGVGDEVTVQGPKKTYGSTIELVDATFISVSKSLIKVEDVDYGKTGEVDEEGNDIHYSAVPVEGGDFTVTLKCSTGVIAEVPEEAASWLGIKAINGNSIVFHATENVAGPRTVTLVFKTKSGGKEYTAETSINQDGAIGSKDLPMNISEAIAYTKTLGNGGLSPKEFYVKGLVSRIADKGEFGSYGNATLWLSDDGEFLGTDDKNPDVDHDFEAYRILWLGNQKWVEGNRQIEVGDEVVICAILTSYNGIGESKDKVSYIYSINTVTDNMVGDGSLENPFNVPAAICLANKLKGASEENYYVEGKISKVVYPYDANYGTGTFWISEDGVYNNDLSKDFEAYSTYWLGNKKWADGNENIAVGDDVILYGQFTYYKGTSETNKQKAYVYSHNGKTE